MANTMSYASAAVSAPAGGTDASYVFYKAIFDHIFAQHNATDALVSGATTTGTSGKLALYGAAGSLQPGPLVVTTPNDASWNGVFVNAPTGFSANAFAYNLNGVGKFTVSSAGNLTAQGITALGALQASTTLAVTSTSTFTGAATFSGGLTGTLTGTATGLAAPIGFDTVVSDYKLSTNASAQTISVAAGGGYFDSAGAWIGGFNARTINLSNAVSSTQPTGTNVQNVAISAAPSTGALVATGGTVAALGTATTPSAPAGNTPLGMVIWRGATTNPSNVVASGDIFNGRFPSGAGVGGGGGSGGAPTTAQYLLSGTNGSLPNALDVTNPAINLSIQPALVRAGQYEGSVVDPLNGQVQADTISRLSTSGAVASMAFSPSSPWSLSAVGRTRTASASAQPALSATASGTANQQRTLYADLNSVSPGAADHGIRMGFLAPGVGRTQYQTPIANFWYDGSTITPAATAAFTPFIDFSPLASLGSHQVGLNYVKIADNGTVGTYTPTQNVFGTWPSFTDQAFTLPAPMQGLLVLQLACNMSVAAGTFIGLAAYIDGVQVSALTPIGSVTTGNYTPLHVTLLLTGTIAAGAHTLSLKAESVGNGTNTITLSGAGLGNGALYFFKPSFP